MGVPATAAWGYTYSIQNRAYYSMYSINILRLFR